MAEMLPCIKGYCAFCDFKRQEQVVAEAPDGQQSVEIDRFCDIHGTFVPEDGYCWAWEEIVRK